MTGEEMRDARRTIGEEMGLGRPLRMTELGKLLALEGLNPGESVHDWERGHTPIRGPTAVAAGSTRPLEIIIVSNWPWDAGDGLGQFVDGESNALKEEFFTAKGNQKAAKLRGTLAVHVGTTVAQFDQFARLLRFQFGYDCWRGMAGRAAERMLYQGLKSDENELLIVVGVVTTIILAMRSAARDGNLDRGAREQLPHPADLPSTVE